MTAVILRIVIYVAIAAILFFGVRRIWRDVTGHFRAEDKERADQRRERDLRERQRPDVIDLKRNDDGVFRPPSDDDRRN